MKHTTSKTVHLRLKATILLSLAFFSAYAQYNMNERKSNNQDPSVTYEYIDLGLSVKWATFNVGSTAPEEYGDYFAWGETEPYYETGYAQEDPQSHWKESYSAGYDFSTYKHCNGSNNTITKYCNRSEYGYNGFTDSKTTLDPEDDAAHVKWGGNWRMPTQAELDELGNTDNCTWTWTTLNGVNGYKVTSKKSGYTDRSIFLPAAGFRFSTRIRNVGSFGYYMSSSLHTDGLSNAWYGFSSEFRFDGNEARFSGRSVRPVCP